MAFKKTSDAPAQVVDLGKPDFDFEYYSVSNRILCGVDTGQSSQKDAWDALTPEQQDKAVEEVVDFYRNVWGFPYAIKTEESGGFVHEFGKDPEKDWWIRNMNNGVIAKDQKKYRKQAFRLRNWNSEKLLYSYSDEEDYVGGLFEEDPTPNVKDEHSRHLKQILTGMGVANAFMPHLHHTPVKGMTSPYDGFLSDKYLPKAVRLALRWDTGAWPHSIRFGLRSIGGIQSVGNFKPTVAKFLWEQYTPDEGGVVFDFSCGWGGRLLGARSSKKDITYIGVDPSVKTFGCLQDLDKYLCKLYGYTPGELSDVEVNGKTVQQYRSDLVRITCCGSEEFCPEDLHGKVDFAFSSPPYFDLEDYASGDEGYENQSHVKFPGRDGWLHGFLKQTADNVFKMIKPGGWVGLNLADFRDTEITGEACKVFESAGFKYMPDQNYEMRISVRTGNRNVDKLADKTHKTESIFIFHKPE